jgi:hypothetical protein
MAERRFNEDQEQISDEDMLGKAADEEEEFEDVEEFDEADQEQEEDIDEQ